MNYSVLQMPPNTAISCERELHTQGNVYVCRDRRKEYCFIAQRLTFVADAINELVGEDVKLSSLYEASRRKQKCGYHYSFSVERMKIAELGDCSFHRYKRVLVLCARHCEIKWKAAPKQPEVDSRV